MTAKELGVLRDKVTRTRLGLVSPQRGDGRGERAVVEESPAPPTAWLQAPRVKYPVTGVASIIECPVHLLVVSLDEHGRINSQCPGCRREAETALGLVA